MIDNFVDFITIKVVLVVAPNIVKITANTTIIARLAMSVIDNCYYYYRHYLRVALAINEHCCC